MFGAFGGLVTKKTGFCSTKQSFFTDTTLSIIQSRLGILPYFSIRLMIVVNTNIYICSAL